jgi:hypothetical protein
MDVNAGTTIFVSQSETKAKGDVIESTRREAGRWKGGKR